MKEWKAVRQSHEPYQEVVIHGCEFDMTDSDLFSILRREKANIANASIFRDKETGLSKGIGFATFSSLQDAKDFVEKTSGLLKLGDRVLRIEYRKNTSWVCGLCGHLNYKMTETGCRKCYVPEMDFVNDGTGDIGSVPSYLVLVRGLDTLTRQETIYNFFKKKTSDLVHVRLVKNKENGNSMGFCFLMFSNVDSGTKLVHDAYNNPISIDGKYLSITYSHQNSFVPVCGSSEWITYSYLDTEYLLVDISYWDEQYYAKEYPKSPPIDPSLIKGKWVPPQVPEIQNDQVEPPGETTSAIIVEKEPVIYSQIMETSQGNEQESIEESQTLKKPRIIDPKDKNSLQFLKWQERQEELLQPIDTINLSLEELKKKLPPEEELNQRYSDLNLIACLLCERQFKSVETLEKHQAKSQLHRTNMDELLDKKLEELRQQNLDQIEQESEMKYRDRALEMRTLQGSGKKKIAFSLKPNAGRLKTRPTISTFKPISSDNIGKKMLEKMGWKSGQGLGANKDGITEPIKPTNYNSGAGLGSLSRNPKNR